MKIYKYPIKIKNAQIISMPIGAEILTVQKQGENVCLWAKVDESARTSFRTIEVIGTGHPMNDENLLYLGTVQEEAGLLVWHVFERQLKSAAE